MAIETEAVRAERVGLDDLGAGADVVLVDLPDDVRPRHVELLEVLRDEDAALVQQRPHRAVEHEQRLQGLAERDVPACGHHCTLCYCIVMDFGIVTAKIDGIGYITHAENLGYSH